MVRRIQKSTIRGPQSYFGIRVHLAYQTADSRWILLCVPPDRLGARRDFPGGGKILPAVGFKPQNTVTFLGRPLHPLQPAWAESPRDWKLPARIARNIALALCAPSHFAPELDIGLPASPANIQFPMATSVDIRETSRELPVSAVTRAYCRMSRDLENRFFRASKRSD